MEGPRVIQVIQSRVREGKGTDADPVRWVTEYHTLDGKLLARADFYRLLSFESRATASQPNSDSVAEGAAFGTHPILGEWTL